MTLDPPDLAPPDQPVWRDPEDGSLVWDEEALRAVDPELADLVDQATGAVFRVAVAGSEGVNAGRCVWIAVDSGQAPLPETRECFDAQDRLLEARKRLHRLQRSAEARLSNETWGDEILWALLEDILLPCTQSAELKLNAVPAILTGAVQAILKIGSAADLDESVRVFGLKPLVRPPSNGVPSVPDRIDRIVGLCRVFGTSGEVERNYSTYVGKPRRYYAGAVRNESGRDWGEQLRATQDRLGLTWVAPEARSRLNRTAVPLDEDGSSGAGYPLSEVDLGLARIEEVQEQLAFDDAVRLALSAEIERMPERQGQLLKLVLKGQTFTEARRHLGFPLSVETALRNRLKRSKSLRKLANRLAC